MSPRVLGSSYTLLVFSTHKPPKRFTAAATCGMKGTVTGARILLSLSPSFPLVRAPALATWTVAQHLGVDVLRQ